MPRHETLFQQSSLYGVLLARTDILLSNTLLWWGPDSLHENKG